MAFSVAQPIVLVLTSDHANGKQGRILNIWIDDMEGRSIWEVDEWVVQEVCAWLPS
mgnify:CR=1 FL=1